MPLRIASLHLTYHHHNHYQQRYFSGQSLDSIWTDFMTCGFKFHIILSSQEAVQLLSHVQLFVTPWATAAQTSLFFTISQSLLKLRSIESMMPSNHFILCCSFLLLLSNIRVFSNELALHIRWPQYWKFSISASNEYSGLISFPLISLLAKGFSSVFSSITVWRHQFFSTQPSLWLNSHIQIWLLEKP